MTGLPNPFSESGVVSSPPDETAAPVAWEIPGAAADIQSSCGGVEGHALGDDKLIGKCRNEPTQRSRHGRSEVTTTREAGIKPGPQEAIADLLEAIGGECRFVLNEEEFMAAVELPLFLRTA